MKHLPFNPSARTVRRTQPVDTSMNPKLIRTSICALVVGAFLLGGTASAKSRRSHADNTPGSFDYYLLTLSWAPEFCATHVSSASSSECDPAHHFGFVVHGLWPENEDGSYPQHCAGASPVSQDIVRQMLPLMPDRGLIQHEWATHGTCSGLDAQTYFGDIKTAFSKLQIPSDYRAPSQPLSASPSQIEQKFATANNAPASAFRVSCSGSEFVAVEVCLTKDLQYRQCGNGLRECRAPQVTLLPPK
jgi:ribonuclease T2